jgi:hypothetical protein
MDCPSWAEWAEWAVWADSVGMCSRVALCVWRYTRSCAKRSGATAVPIAGLEVLLARGAAIAPLLLQVVAVPVDGLVVLGRCGAGE